jgi:hypothetical protein
MIRTTRWMVALVAGGSLAACSGGGSFADRESAASSPSSSSASSSSSSAGSSATSGAPSELAKGLLPAEAFGEQATVVPLTRDQLQQGAGLAPSVKDLKVSPPECATAVQGTQPDVTAFDDIAAQSATTGGAISIEVLLSGGPTSGSLDAMEQAVSRCPSVQISAPSIGTATITFRSVPVDELGDGAAALQFTTTVKQPDGNTLSVPALVGVVRDGDRVVTLLTLAQNGAPPDPAAFTGLLQQAYEVQAKALD